MHLEDDDACVDWILRDPEVPAFSRLPEEGHGAAPSAGWYGEAAPFRSRMVLAFADDALADCVPGAVRACTSIEDPRHPIRASKLNVKDAAYCGCEGGTE